MRFLRLSSYLRKSQVGNTTNCYSLLSANFFQSTKASCTETTEKQPPLYSTQRTTQKKRARHSAHTNTQTPISEIKQEAALTQSFGKAVTWLTDTVQYLQILTLIMCDQEGGLAPSLLAILLFILSLPAAKNNTGWIRLSCWGIPRAKTGPALSSVSGSGGEKGRNTAKPTGQTLCPRTLRTIP